MSTALNATQVPRRYWYNQQWLALPVRIHDPTYFHLLGLEPEVQDVQAVSQAGASVLARIRQQSVHPISFSDQEVAHALLGVLLQARATLRDPGRRKAYENELCEAYRRRIGDFLRDWEIDTSAGLSAGIRSHLQALRHDFSLTETAAQAAIEATLSDLSARPRSGTLDPAYPTFYDVLGVSDDISEAELSALSCTVAQRIQELQEKARKNNQPNLKFRYLSAAKKLEEAAAVLANRLLRVAHQGEIHALRRASFAAEVCRQVVEGETSLPIKVWIGLIQFAAGCRLSEQEALAYLRERGLSEAVAPPCREVTGSRCNLERATGADSAENLLSPDARTADRPSSFLEFDEELRNTLRRADEVRTGQFCENDWREAVGISLGGTYSAIAAIDESGRIEVVANAEGLLLTPSAVLWEGDGVMIVGAHAKAIGPTRPTRYFECVKRCMGNEDVKFELDGEIYGPEVISAIILAKLVKDASARLGKPVRSAVITVPAWFNDAARQATLRAAQLAGIYVLDLLSEPVAAALAYGLGQGQKCKTILVFDLGGSTFDVTLLRLLDDGSFEQLARDGDIAVGGKEWNEHIISRVAAAFQAEHGQEIPVDSIAYATLIVEAEKAKKFLTQSSKTRIFVTHEGKDLALTVTREEFGNWTASLLAFTEDRIHRLFSEARLCPGQIDVVLPVGGMSKIPQIQGMLKRIFGSKVDHAVEKDLAIALGSCWHCAKLLISRRPILVDPSSLQAPELERQSSVAIEEIPAPQKALE